jgi:hypothetical protein
MKTFISNYPNVAKLVLAFTLTVASIAPASALALAGNGSLVYSCATYGSYFCCQAFVYTRYGWVEASDPGWYSTATF